MAAKPMAAVGQFNASLFRPPLSVGQFMPTSPEVTPGNVGICLSGGGSRALSAGMGQLRALKYLQANGKSLLSQVKAISTVSGGSWLGVPFEYLTPGTSDDDFLNLYVPDPRQLVPSNGPTPAVTLDVLPSGNIGNSISTELFSIEALAVEAYLLYKVFSVPSNMLWQTLMGLHILAPYGLYPFEASLRPTSFFTCNQTTLSQIVQQNPSLKSGPANLFADATNPSATRRPFHVCNTAMFLNEPNTILKYLAPVQATAFMTGNVGRPSGTDNNGLQPGGGGVTSFAFNSRPVAVNGNSVTVSQARQFALMDIVGVSSAAFAEILQNLFAGWLLEFGHDPAAFLLKLEGLLVKYGEEIVAWIEHHLTGADVLKARAFLATSPVAMQAVGTLSIGSILSDLQELIPEYDYWPVANAAPLAQINPTRFADGGSLENTGINALLAYSDTDNIVVFLNTESALRKDTNGVIVVDSALPPLFGYQPYDAVSGYVLYAGATWISPENLMFAQNQVFASAEFQKLLEGLWSASGSGSSTNSAIYKQTLTVQPNIWFGVPGNKTVTVVWVYNNPVQRWYDELSPDVQAILRQPDFQDFPNYSTLDTDLSATQINLLAHLTGWNVACPDNAALFQNLFAITQRCDHRGTTTRRSTANQFFGARSLRLPPHHGHKTSEHRDQRRHHGSLPGGASAAGIGSRFPGKLPNDRAD
jgi:hypothetical protein